MRGKPDAEQSFLDGVLGQRAAPQDSERHAEGLLLKKIAEFAKRSRVAVLPDGGKECNGIFGSRVFHG